MVHRVAIVGAGRMGQEYALAYAAFPETVVVAFVDPNEARTQAGAMRSATFLPPMPPACPSASQFVRARRLVLEHGVQVLVSTQSDRRASLLLSVLRALPATEHSVHPSLPLAFDQ